MTVNNTKLFQQMSCQDFLENYWQQKPLLIKKALVDFKDLVSADELAGLAAEPQIESRLIHFDPMKKKWQASLGPFDDYQSLGEENWTLVVQSINHWLCLDDFLAHFDFIPRWQFDDIMSSFAAKGGSVGPHVDYYDVFICQGSGQRRWKVGQRDSNLKEVIAHEKLLHVEPFDPIMDVVLSAGDILYLPAGYPHEGISLSPSMSFSVGYKSTNENEIISGFADYLLDYHDRPRYLVDRKRKKRQNQSMISQKDLSLLNDFIQKTVSQPALLNDFIARYYSAAMHELDLIDVVIDFDQWMMLFKQSPLIKLGGLKTLYLEDDLFGRFYINGEVQQTTFSKEVVALICDCSQICYDSIFSLDNSENIFQFLYEKTSIGYWYFSEK